MRRYRHLGEKVIKLEIKPGTKRNPRSIWSVS